MRPEQAQVARAYESPAEAPAGWLPASVPSPPKCFPASCPAGALLLDPDMASKRQLESALKDLGFYKDSSQGDSSFWRREEPVEWAEVHVSHADMAYVSTPDSDSQFGTKALSNVDEVKVYFDG